MISEMSSKERVLAALAGEEVDRLPFSPNLAYLFESLPADLQALGHDGFFELVGADNLYRFCPCPSVTVPPDTVETEEWRKGDRKGQVIRAPVGELSMEWIHSGEESDTWFLTEHPLKTEEDYKVQTWIEENSRLVENHQVVREHLRGRGPRGVCLGMLLPRLKSAYQTLVESYAGTEELVYALCDFPDTVETLWRTMVAKNLEAVRIAARSDYDFFITWEDSSTQNYSPSQYDTYIASEISQWCAILGGNGKKYIQHACGHVRDLLPSMRGEGVLGVESLSPAPTGNLSLGEARAALGDRCAIVGGIEPTRFLELGLHELGPYVEEIIEQGLGGPFILANSDSCPPGVTVEKFKLVAEIAKNTRSPRFHA